MNPAPGREGKPQNLVSLHTYLSRMRETWTGESKWEGVAFPQPPCFVCVIYLRTSWAETTTEASSAAAPASKNPNSHCPVRSQFPLW